jgi:signal transduction histidine kinase
VPFQIPAFLSDEAKSYGSITIFFKDKGSHERPCEALHVELLARRLSYDIAKKKILTLYKLNKYKENISDKVFVRLTKRQGVKLKDIFTSLIPELEEYLQVKSCSLFSVSNDQKFIRLEAAHPIELTYHKLGYTFTVSHHPYFDAVINGIVQYGDHPHERIDPAYLLIKSPLLSELTTPGLREFAKAHDIHSILVIPLMTGNIVRYLMAFYATQQKQFFTNEEIETLTFFAKEIMKALRMEILDDVLHDFKNPAIAISGFALRAKKLLKGRQPLDSVQEKLSQYIDIILKETGRLQDIAFQMEVVGREEVLDLCKTASERFAMNEAAINESRMKNIKLEQKGCELGLNVYCSKFGLERVFDNLLSNATKAIPKEGGILSMRCYSEPAMACLEITNTGEIPEEMIKKIKAGDVAGRGLNIITRFVYANHGKFDIQSSDGFTTIIIRLPLSDIKT